MIPRGLAHVMADAFFPPRCLLCDEVLGFLPECPACRGEMARLSRMRMPAVNAVPLVLDAAFSAFWYEDGVKEAVHRMKFGDRPDIARAFAKAMAKVLPEHFSADGVVPVPSSRKRIAQRGYDVPLLLAGYTARERTLALRAGLLKKTRETVPQTELSGAERRKNLKGAFRVADGENVCGKTFLLVDDVFTTGTTLEQCAKALKAAGAARVCAVTAAVTRFAPPET